jgi:hypothetical protein
MNLKKLLLYVLVPATLSLTLIEMYFHGGLVLQRLVSPKLPPLALNAWRELGVLENLQNLLLIAMLLVCVSAAVRGRATLEKAAFALLSAFTLFVLLEEVDYGTHWVAYLGSDHDFQWFLPAVQWPRELIDKIDFAAEPFNLHNKGDLTDIIKTFVAVVMGGLFVAAPFVLPRMKNPWLRYIAPDPYVVLTLVAMGLLSVYTHYLGGVEAAIIKADALDKLASGEPGSISNNLSEFREATIYYLFLVYLADVAFFRAAPAKENHAAQEETASGTEA